MSTDGAKPPEVDNSITGEVSGTSVQAGVVHGGVHLHAGRALAELGQAFDSQPALLRLMADLEAVHRDYLLMFNSVLDETPDAWAHGEAGFTEQVGKVAKSLRRLRVDFEPVRVRVHALAAAFSEAPLSAPERAFAVAVLKYFPTGEIARTGPPQGAAAAITVSTRTSGTAVLDHLYRALDGELGQELSGLIKDTITFHQQRWAVVCTAFAALHVA
ncbi:MULTISPECIES: hypothetical protein [unclassified Crossiella]|uniref:hypothetical protein n=1 Tax=unclassified Crossiella TaxID=2620835 RepID=UPI001FFE8658|nr:MULTISPECIES: hypothetical protein [unclassified Crossiella]MCK2239203.1 hypothetical protein [Crossiella sp. S99.2]MCK2251228.1 hypothetical protein [Crossiella sp. S99.1]